MARVDTRFGAPGPRGAGGALLPKVEEPPGSQLAGPSEGLHPAEGFFDAFADAQIRLFEVRVDSIVTCRSVVPRMLESPQAELVTPRLACPSHPVEACQGS
jgi:hypothetical protein